MCEGTGKFVGFDCPKCGGTGKSRVAATVVEQSSPQSPTSEDVHPEEQQAAAVQLEAYEALGPEEEADMQAQLQAMEDLVGTSAVAVPELLFCSSLDGHGDGHLQPTHAQLDTALGVLSLLPLGPIGPAVKVPLSQVAHVGQPTDLSDNLVEIEVLEPASTGVTRGLRFMLADEEQASALVAALTMQDRVFPGADLSTPASTSG